MVLLLGMTAACFAVSEAMWRFSLRHYTSAAANASSFVEKYA